MKETAMPELRTPRQNALEAISTLEHSSESLTAHALEHARAIAYLIEREDSPMPFVFPTEIGGIQFEWKGTESGRELNLEILPEGQHLAYLTIIDGKPIAEAEINDDFEHKICSLLNWMRSR
jgi:hypothetical protein